MRSSLLPVLVLLLAGAVRAQIPLASGTYTQNFDSLATGLPSGWEVYTSSTASTLGTAGSFTTAATAWNSATAGTDFRNISSDNIAAGSASADQTANLNRAFGWRPVGADAAEVAPARSGSILVTFANTSGLAVKVLSLRIFTANDVSSTTQNYQFEYRVGDTGSFTALGSPYATAAPFAAATLSADASALAALSGRSAKVYVRVRGTATSGTTLDTLGIDDFTITTAPLPVISTQPVSQTGTLGDTVSFSVVATGTGPLTYQWRRGGIAITANPSATTATLTLSPVAPADGGGYDVVVTDANGSITSAAATLTFNKSAATVSLANLSVPYSGAPQQPTVTTVPANRNVVLTFDGSTTPPVNPGSYAVVATIDDPLYAGSATGTFRIEKVAATVTLGSLLQTFTGTPRPITVTTDPAGLVVAVTYDGSPTAPSNAGSYAVLATVNHANYQGAASGTLNIIGGAGGGGTTRQPQTLTLVAAPAGVPAGTGLRLRPTSSSGLPVTLALVSGSGSLVSDVLTGTGGAVVVRASQAGDATYEPATLERTYTFVAGGVAPFLTLSPANETVLAGSSVTFRGGAIGSPAPTYQWFKDGVAIAGATDARFTLAAVTLADAGAYRLDAINAAGTASGSATLTVRAAPAIVTQPADQSIAGGQPAVFTVAVTGFPAPALQWRRNGVDLPGATGPTLTLASPRNSDEGRYDVVVTNELGSVTSTAALLQVDMADVTGMYFGRFAGTAGEFVLHAREDGTGAFIGHLPALRTGIVAPDLRIDFAGNFAVNITTLAASPEVDGVSQFSGFATPPSARAPQPVTLRGTLSEAGGTLTGTIAELGLTLEGVRAGRSGPAQAQAGFYRAAMAGSADGRGYIAVAPDGRAFVFTASGAALDSASGQLNAQGRLQLTTTTQAQLNLGFANGVVSGTARLPNGTTGTIAGSIMELARTERLVNLAVRSVVGRNVPLITGFVITGTAPKRVLLRAAGPALSGQPFNVPNTMGNPSIQLYRGGTVVAQNDNWSASATDATAITDAGTQAGAFPFRRGSGDAALLQTLAPGAYTVQIGGGGGAALAEVYEVLETGEPVGGRRLVNLSTRGTVTAAAPLIAGFVIAGSAPQRVLIRGIGPALAGAPFNVADPLADPQLTLFRDRRSIKTNRSWARDPDAALIREAAAETGAFPLAANSLDAAILIFLEPGAYTAQVQPASGSADTSGAAMVEVYEAPMND